MMVFFEITVYLDSIKRNDKKSDDKAQQRWLRTCIQNAYLTLVIQLLFIRRHFFITSVR